MMPTRWIVAVLALAAAWLPGIANAHPHAWIDLRVRVVFDDRGRVEALRQTWRFDPFFSLLALEGLRAPDKSASMDERLDRMGARIRATIEGQHYFTRLTYDGETAALGEVSEYATSIVGERLEFRFTLPLAQPLAMGDAPLRYKIFDPGYYIEVVHALEDGALSPAALSLSNAPADCRTQILMPDPDPAKVLQAAMLDRDESGAPGLGRFFAETGVVRCER